MIFPVSKLIEHQDELVTARKTDTVRSALVSMVSNDFSQLPVVDENGFLTGVISEQSIARSYFYGNDSVSLFDLPVHHCQAPPVIILPDDDVFEALSRLEDVAAIIVVRERKPVGVVTYYDVTEFFRGVSEGLMYVEDIEVTLRQYIDSEFQEGQKFDNALIAVFGEDKKSPGRPNKSYAQMTFYDHMQFITHNTNWQCFAAYFQPLELFSQLMDQVRVIRNQLAHFRDDISIVQLHALRHTRDWLAARPKTLKPATPNDLVTGTLVAEAAVIRATMKSAGRYAPLQVWLEQRPPQTKRVEMTFRQVEELLGEDLPASARNHSSWWANDSVGHVQAKSWLEVGWRTADVDTETEIVVFERSNSVRYQQFFSDVLQHVQEIRPGLCNWITPGARNWLDFASGTPGFRFGWSFTNKHALRIELTIDTGDKQRNEELFEKLKTKREVIEAKLSVSLGWERLDHRKSCRVGWERQGTIIDPAEHLSQLKEWAAIGMVTFHDTLQPYVQGLDIE